MEEEEGDAGAGAGDTLDPWIRHERVDRSIPDKIADDVIADLVLRGGRNAQPAGLDERVYGFLEVLLLFLLRHLVPFVLHRAVQGVLDHVQELFLLCVQLRLPDLVNVLGPVVVVDDPRVRERLPNRDDLDLFQGVAREVRDVCEVGATGPGPLRLLLDRAPRHHDLPLLRHLGFPQNWTFCVVSPIPTWTWACCRRNVVSGRTARFQSWRRIV